jgi:phosphonate transport system ATP-binding protein
MEVCLESIQVQHRAVETRAPNAIDALNLKLSSGEHLAIIGPSGAGKTTLLQAIATGIKPLEGEVRLGGLDPWALNARALKQLRSRVFYAPQVPPLPPRQRVVTSLSSAKLAKLSLYASVLNLLVPRFAQSAYEALMAFDLEDKLWQRVDRLSGGERQRVGLAKALMSSAELWLIDEPLSALDPKRCQQAIEALVNEATRRNVTLVVSLHQVDIARAMFPRIAGLRNGQLVFDRDRESLTENDLKRLYENFEHELHDLPQPDKKQDLAITTEPPLVIACR